MADIRNRSLTLADCRFDWTFHGYDKAFNKEATFSDIDSVLLWKGKFLFIEMKSARIYDDLPELSNGQKLVYETLISQGNSCWLVTGDMQKSVPFFVQDLENGEVHDLRRLCEIDARSFLRNKISQWKESIDNSTER